MSKLAVIMISIGVFLLSIEGRGAYAAKDEFTVGGWQGSAHFYDTTSDFSRCEMHALYDGGTYLIFSMKELGGDLFIGMFNNEWALEKGATYSIDVTIDDFRLGVFNADAVSVKEIRMAVDYSTSLINILRRGRGLFIDAEDSSFSFTLKNTYEAFPRLEECIRMQVASPGDGSNPFDKQGTNSGSGAKSPFSKADFELLLSGAGLEGFDYVDPGEIPIFEGAIHGWLYKRALGAFFAENLGSNTISKFTSNFITSLSDWCTEKATYSVDDVSADTGFDARRVLTRCVVGDMSMVYPMIVFKYERIVIVFLQAAVAENSAVAIEADEKIYQYLKRVFGN